MNLASCKCTIRVLAVVFLLLISGSFVFTDRGTTGLKYLKEQSAPGSRYPLVKDVVPIGDFNRDGFQDMVVTMPTDTSGGRDAGRLLYFKGSDEGFPAFSPGNADLIIRGEPDYLFGQSVAAWDYSGDGWLDLAVGCPGADNGSGRVLIFESTDINAASSGATLSCDRSALNVTSPDTYFFGSHLTVGRITEDELSDLMVLSMSNGILSPKAKLFSGGVIPEYGYEIALEDDSVANRTATACVDLFGEGREAFVYSSPDNGEIKVIQINVTFDTIMLPGANETGVVDFQGSIQSTANTFGWGAGDDGWDTSLTHIYDGSTGYDSVRYNQATGNARGDDRSVGTENQLFIEVGGVLGTSNGRDMSGAYGVSFTLTSNNVSGINSAVLSFDFEWENWGFEANERYWIKARLTDSTGDVHWLGQEFDRGAPTDPEPEIYSSLGRGNPGQNLAGIGKYSSDVLALIDGPGEYYFDVGGKISEWTNNQEFEGVGIDNVKFVLRTLTHDVREIRGGSQIGLALSKADADDDGSMDLVVSSPNDGKISIFRGGEPYWWNLASINQGMANYTIEGSAGNGFGAALLNAPPNPFVPGSSLLISETLVTRTGSGIGAVHLFELPLNGSLMPLAWAKETNWAPIDVHDFGWDMVNSGDNDENGYPELIIFGWNQTNNLFALLADRSPSPPQLWIDNPRRHDTVSGHVEIRARVFDPDGDAGPEDIRFFRSIDNRSWNTIGNGRPDRIEGDTAIKDWYTNLDENSGYFFKVEVEDDFGLSVVKYTDRVDVLNHEPPIVDLIYPADGTELRAGEDITARIIISSDEELEPPVRFLYSRNNLTWYEYANRTKAVEGSDIDYIARLNTETMKDGPIWFKINATTVYGLGSEDRNIGPCHINNYYPPDAAITFPAPNATLTGMVNITANVSDPDDDIREPVEFNVKTPDVELFDFVGNMTRGANGTYYYLWDTTTLENGRYDIMVRVTDKTFFKMEATLNNTIRIKNYYTPEVTLSGASEGDTISGELTLKAVIWDRDRNYIEKGIIFEYSLSGEENWTSLGRGLLIGTQAEFSWITTTVLNGVYDVRVRVTDEDNLTAVSRINGITVRNPYHPKIYPRLPSGGQTVSATLRLRFNVSDDGPIPPGNVKIEVFAYDQWRELTGLTRETAGGSFVPWSNISFYVDWDTTQKGEDGKPLFPDSIGYEVRITVTDEEGLKTVYESPFSYTVKNKDDSPDDDDGGGEALFLPGWAIAAILLGAIILVVCIFLFFIFWSGRKKEKDAVHVKVKDITARPKPRIHEETKIVTPMDEKVEDVYKPPGWKAPPAETRPSEAPMFAVGAETPDLGLDLGLGMAEEEEEELVDVRDSLFGEKPKRKPPAKKKEPSAVPYVEESIDVELPEGVMPTGPPVSREKAESWDEVEIEEEEEEEWGGAEAWEEEEEEEFEELEEEDWGEMEDEEEEGWEDLEEEEEEEDYFVVTCKCGEEIEIPGDFKGSKFLCPTCGRKSRIPGR
ncbi:MAG: Ig-like domain-containing protein [Thermoplasmatota archaeon]